MDELFTKEELAYLRARVADAIHNRSTAMRARLDNFGRKPTKEEQARMKFLQALLDKLKGLK
jgi:hypothetical protein